MRDDDQDRANDHAGHRARLRDRLLGGGGLLDHELLEYLLTTAIPRRDTKPIAKALLREFHDIGGVLTADPGALQKVDGIGETAAATLKIAGRAVSGMLYEFTRPCATITSRSLGA